VSRPQLSRFKATSVYIVAGQGRDAAPASTETAVEELRRHVLAVVSRFLRGPEDTEDVAQEALLRLVRARSNGRLLTNERAFVTRTAVRLAIDRIRASRTRSAKLSELGRQRPRSTEPPRLPPEVQRLYEAIAALPAKQAAVVTLRKLMELDYPDIAALLGISVENCRSHCRHGLRRLRTLLQEPP